MIFRFLDYELDAERFELRRGEDRQPADRMAIDLLLYLVRHRDRVVAPC